MHESSVAQGTWSIPLTRGRTCNPWIARQIPHHWTTSEVLQQFEIMYPNVLELSDLDKAVSTSLSSFSPLFTTPQLSWQLHWPPFFAPHQTHLCLRTFVLTVSSPQILTWFTHLLCFHKAPLHNREKTRWRQKMQSLFIISLIFRIKQPPQNSTSRIWSWQPQPLFAGTETVSSTLLWIAAHDEDPEVEGERPTWALPGRPHSPQERRHHPETVESHSFQLLTL